MRKLIRTVVARRLLGLSDIVGDRHVINVAVGPRLEPVVLSLGQPPDYRVESPGSASFAKRRADRPNGFRIHYRAESEWRALDLAATVENYHAVQPLGEDEWLLIRGRAESDDDRNAHVYDATGRRVRSFPAGDGIQDAQTTANGNIWVSYFDEGVFGSIKLGAAGLVCLDSQGQCKFRFTDVLGEGVPEISDCYALNVVSDEDVWLCYYTDFPLVRLLDGKVADFWPNVPVQGSSGFAVEEELVLFAGSYDDTESLYLLRPGEKRARKLAPTGDDGRRITGFSAFGRGNRLFLQTEEALYGVDVADVLSG